MPRRELREALAPPPQLAMVPTASSVDMATHKSLLRMVMMPNLEAKVILAWVIWFILRQLQSILGPRRRHSRHWLVQYGAMAAYYLPTLIAFYTANAVFSSDSDFKVSLSNGCLFLLFSCARGSVTMTAFTLGDSSLRLEFWRLLPWLLYFAWLQWGFIWSDHNVTVSDLYYFLVLCIAPLLYVLLAKPRAAILDYETKEFADYMYTMHQTTFFGDGNNANDNNLLYDRCKYPFTQLKDESRSWINFTEVLQQRDRLLGLGDGTGVDPLDNCLSYIFCRLLARRYFRFPCAEDGNTQVRAFVLSELLQPCTCTIMNQQQDCNCNKRAFAIVEVQLALLHDYFFTNFHSDITSGLVSLKQTMKVAFWTFPFFVISYALGFLLAGGYKEGLSGVVFLCASAVPAVLLYMLVVLPRCPFLPRYWHPIQNLLLYYSTTATPESPSGPAARRCQSSRLYYWRNKLGQYSVMEDYDRRSFKKRVIAWCKVHVLSRALYSFMEHHPAYEEDVIVPRSVKKFLADTLRDITRQPTMDGYNRVLGDLSWTLNQGPLTHTILIWHIATCYCDMLLPQSQPLSSPEAKTNHEVATVVSRYCAYLVAFLPELLPDHTLTAKVVLQQVLKQTRDVLLPTSQRNTRMSMEEKRTNIHGLQLPQDETRLTTFHKGVRLGRQLQQQGDDVSLRWKVMADFWAEMILYIAGSPDNAATHVEQLAQGGEFVTHLWALLCNAGIVIKAGHGGMDSVVSGAYTEFTFSAMLTGHHRTGGR